MLLLAVLSWVGVGGFLGFVFVSTTRELGALEPQLEQTRAEHRRFRAFLTEKRHQETIRDSLRRPDRRHPHRGRRPLRVAARAG